MTTIRGWGGAASLKIGAFLALLAVGNPGLVCGQEEKSAAEKALSVEAEQMFRLSVPVLYDRTPIASIEAKVATGGRFEAGREDVLKVLSNVLNDSALAEVRAALGDVEVVTPVEAEQAGFQMVFDPQIVGLVLTTDREARRDTDLRISEAYDNSGIFERSPDPASVSAFFNLTTGLIFDPDNTDSEFGTLIGGNGAVRALDFVLRGNALYDTAEEQFEVGSVQLVRDFVDQDVRAILGDINTVTGDLIGGEDIIGLSLSHRSGRFGRQRTIESLTPEVFNLDRSAIVEIYVNGDLRRRLRLAPGRYNLSEFGLTTGANEILIVTIDDRGQRDETTLTAFSDAALLPAGELLWEFAGGFITEEDLVEFDFEFEEQDLVATGRLSYGASTDLTASVAGIARDEGQAASISLDYASLIGFFGVDFAASISGDDVGGAAAVVFSPYLPDSIAIPGRSFSVSAFAASDSFSSVALPDADNEQYRFAARLTEPLDLFGLPASTALFGSYQVFGDDEDQYQLGASLGFTLDPDISISLGAAYERDIDGKNDVVGFASLSKSFGPNFAVSSAYTTDDNTLLAAATYQNQLGGVGTLRAAVAAESSDESDTALSGTLSYTANRFELAATHFQELIDQDDSNDIGSTTTLTASTAIVFADGKFGISRPVSDSFAIITPHPSIGDADVELNPGIGDAGPEMRSDGFGPLVARGLASYSANTIRVKVEDLPIGYDLGQGLYDVAGPLNAGFTLALGSDRAASAVGTFFDEFGEPLQFSSGRVTSQDDVGFADQRIFTNRAGRFAVQGLVPGRTYIVEMDGYEGQTQFRTDPDLFGVNQIGNISVR